METKMSGRKIRFTKMHGAGNDYIYVNTLIYNIDNPEERGKGDCRHSGCSPYRRDWRRTHIRNTR